MAKVEFAVPHDLDAAEARRRIEAGLPKLQAAIPGNAEVEAEWQGAERMVLTIRVMGQTVTVDGEVTETEVLGVTKVPMMMSMMAGQIGDMVTESITRMLAKPVAA
ncbi:polyhydroxyalkanoic acid system family protein [Pseudooceanicola sp.]|jgi:hypothetical protein|uniref:polyhydroxyalkanoic acid system family protein n=1 Tax=Pseudooceanicola sp. TaxID=1914328 RepID=UPI004058AD6D